MRVLLDESLPRHLTPYLTHHDVRTVRKMGWGGTKNGALLTAATGLFDVLLTADQNIEYQQDVSKYPLGVVVIVARSNRIEDLIPLVPGTLHAISSVQPGHLVRAEDTTCASLRMPLSPS